MNICLKSVMVGVLAAILCFFFLNKREEALIKKGEISKLLKDYRTSRYKATYDIKIHTEDPSLESETVSQLSRRFKLLLDSATITKKEKGIYLVEHNTDDTTLSDLLFTSYDVAFCEAYTLPELLTGLKKIQELSDSLMPVQKPNSNLLSDELAAQTQTESSTKLRLNVAPNGTVYHVAELGSVAEQHLSWLDSVFTLPAIQAAFPPDMKIIFSPKEKSASGTSEIFNVYATKGNSSIWEKNKNHIKQAVQTYEPVTGQPAISLELDNYGAAMFEILTKRNVGKPIAIVSKREAISVPIVNETIYGGKISIASGYSSIEETMKVAYKLNAGSLPVEIQVLKADYVLTQKAGIMPGKMLLISALAFLLFSIASFFIFRLLKPLKTR